MKHLLLALVCIAMFCQPSYGSIENMVVSRDDKGNVTFTQHFTVNANSKNSNDFTANTNVEQASTAAEDDSKEILDMSPPFSPCKEKHGKKFIDCMHRLPRELYQKILLTINDEEVEYYYKELKTHLARLEIRATKFTQEEWEALMVAKPDFTAKIDELVRILKK